MAEKLLARILIKNHIQMFASVVKEYLTCEHIEVLATVWLTPVVHNGILLHYKAFIQALKPSTDSVHAVYLRDKISRTTYYVAIADTATANDLTGKCNECCDVATALPDVVVPAVLLEELGCGNDTVGYTFFSVPAALEAGEVYNATGSINGVAFSPVAQTSGFASVAAFITWANTNWSAFGTFAAVGAEITLVSAAGTTGFVRLDRIKYFESGTAPSLTTGQQYHVAITVDGAVLTVYDGGANVTLSSVATALNANAAYNQYGVFSVVSGKLRLVTSVAGTAILAVTAS